MLSSKLLLLVSSQKVNVCNNGGNIIAMKLISEKRRHNKLN